MESDLGSVNVNKEIAQDRHLILKYATCVLVLNGDLGLSGQTVRILAAMVWLFV